MAMNGDRWRFPVNKVMKHCFMRSWKYHEHMTEYWFMKKDYTPLSYIAVAQFDNAVSSTVF
jgi:hypothetical protein